MHFTTYYIQSIYLLTILLTTIFALHDNDFVRTPVYTNQWVIHINGDDNQAKHIANKHDFTFHGKLGSLDGHYILEHKDVMKRSRRSADTHHELLEKHPDVRWVQQQKILSRKRRGFYKSNDPLFPLQWYLQNSGQTSQICQAYKGFEALDANVVECWNKNITGEGVVVSILDDGIEHSHPDLQRNFDARASYDFNDMNEDPFPRYTKDNINKHGTRKKVLHKMLTSKFRCAGEVAAEINNGICGAGIAYNARVGGIRMLDGEVTDVVEAASLSFKPQYVDIYSSSWGPDDYGKTVDGPNLLALKAFENGVTTGRRGRGSIFVWATGNGGYYNDHCSCDGYINSPFTISIGAVDNCGRKPWYVEQCPGTLAVTYSSGGSNDLQISTTDLHSKCTKKHTGTSAAAPLATGIFALVLQANPKLTWRDLQHLIVKTSKVVSPHHPGWRSNHAGYKVNSNFGFGALDAGALVKAAQSKEWKTARPQHICTTDLNDVYIPLKPRGNIRTSIKTNACASEKKKCITKLEHVQLIISLDKQYHRGQLEIDLLAPTGTKSDILRRRSADSDVPNGFQNWAFLTVFHWDENPSGEWTISITDHSFSAGTFKNWRLKFYGTCDPDVKSLPDATSSMLDHDKNICKKTCKPGCPNVLSEHCFECDHFCDCTTGACVPVCDEKLVAVERTRHCQKDMNYKEFPFIPINGYPRKNTGHKKSTFGDISLPIKFLIIGASIIFIACLIGGIVYMTSKMPPSRRKTNTAYRIQMKTGSLVVEATSSDDISQSDDTQSDASLSDVADNQSHDE